MPPTTCVPPGASAAPTTCVPPRASADAPPPARPDLPAGVAVSFAGTGAKGAWVLRRSATANDPVVLFLHGWGAVDPAIYGAWLAHLVSHGSTVVYPIYQDAPFLAPAVAFAGVVAGVRAATREEHLPKTRWIVAGHSAGGAMSADYAARAKALGLPPAEAVFAVYPGRQIGGIPLKLPAADPRDIPAGTDLTALYGADDETVGDVTAKRTIAEAVTTRKRLVEITDPAVDDHSGPLRTGASARRAFWAPLDRLIAAR